MTEYIINMWSGGSTNGTNTIYRCSRKGDWLKKIEELKTEYHITGKRCRVIERGELVIFSFPVAESGYFAWRFAEFVTSKGTVTYGFPKGISEI